MKKQIWKYNLNPGTTEIEMPKGAKVLTVQLQGEGPRLWVEVYPDNDTELRYFESFGTGHDMAMYGEMIYIGTFQLNNGALVFHTYERIA